MPLSPRIIIIATIVIALFILLSLGQETHRRWQVQKEVAGLEQEARTLQNQVIELENLNQYFRTPDYQERLAREKLGYRAPGEHVVLIPEHDPTQTSDTQNEETPSRESIPRRWWNIFFGEQAAI